jgi:hypothetical protein
VNDFLGKLAVMCSAPGETRTHNRLIRSQMLCPLSYEGVGDDYTTGENLLSISQHNLSVFPHDEIACLLTDGQIVEIVYLLGE